MSSASLPNPEGRGALPGQPGPRPEIVRPPQPARRPYALGWIAASLAVIAAGGLYLNRERVTQQKGGGPPAIVGRTAVVAFGDVQRTVRLSGSIQAERFAAIITPRLRGDRGSSSGNRISSRNSSSNVSNVAAGSSSISASTTDIVSTNTSSSTSSSSDTSGATTTQTATSLGATRGTTNRFSDRMTTNTPAAAAATSASSSSTSAAMGSTGLGSTAGDIPSGSSTGGGGSSNASGDFGLILMKMPNAGAHVKKGTVVAEFDRVYMLNRIDDYKDTVIQAEAAIRNKQALLAVDDQAHQQSVRVAKSDMDKAKLDLQTLPVVSTIDAEKLKLAAEETAAHYQQLLKEVPLLKASQKADMRGSELDRDESKIELQKSVTNAERMIMKAPMDGVAVMQSIRRGVDWGQAQQGDQLYPGQPFMQIVDPSSMVVNANVNQVDAELLRIGMKAVVRLDAFPGVALPAHVYAIGAVPIAGRRPNFMREIPVRLKLEKTDPHLAPDLSASADVTLETEPQRAIAPVAAIFQDGAAAQPFVFVRSPEGWQKREVELGLRDNVHAAVRSGLSKGDVVALDPPIENAAAPPT